MSTTARLTAVLLDRLARLDQAEHLLLQTRVHDYASPMRDNFARHRRIVNEARRHIDAARFI